MIKIARAGEHRLRCSAPECEAHVDLSAMPLEVGIDGVPRLDRIELAHVLQRVGWVVGVLRPGVLIPQNGGEPLRPDPVALCPLHKPPAAEKAPSE